MIPWLFAACGPPPEVDPCVAVQARPEGIDEVMTLIGDLPTPVTLPCLLSALERPLSLDATSDIFSAQPAVGDRSPRMFLQLGVLVLTVVPEGPGRDLLEFGELMSPEASIKAELHFPLDEVPTEDAPYTRVERPEGGTSCGLCHGEEVEVAPGIYASRPLRPLPDKHVDIEGIAAESAACWDGSERCEILHAVFDHGPVEASALPGGWPTIYDTGSVDRR